MMRNAKFCTISLKLAFTTLEQKMIQKEFKNAVKLVVEKEVAPVLAMDN